MLHALIMAGGRGTRFWPASRNLTPKQLLPIVGEEPMLTQTIARFEGLIDPSKIYVATNRDQAASVRKCAPYLPAQNVIAEPDCRDTAPCIGLAALIMHKRDPDAVIIVAPSDHVIGPLLDFQRTVKAAADSAAGDDAIYVFGVKPTNPSTAYGYIHRGAAIGETDGVPMYTVLAFTEKPDMDKARTFVDSGEYYWNSGLYMFRADAVLKALREHAPSIAAGLDRIGSKLDTPEWECTLNEEYPSLEKISIDYAVTEKAKVVKVAEVSYNWNDIGAWNSLEETEQTDENGNVVRGDHIGMDTQNCVIWGDPDHLVGTIGVSDMVIIQTADATLICSKDNAQDVKTLVERLRQEGRESVL